MSSFKKLLWLDKRDLVWTQREQEKESICAVNLPNPFQGWISQEEQNHKLASIIVILIKSMRHHQPTGKLSCHATWCILKETSILIWKETGERHWCKLTIQVQMPPSLTDAKFITILEWLLQKSYMKLNQKLSKLRHKAAELLMSVPASPEAQLIAQRGCWAGTWRCIQLHLTAVRSQCPIASARAEGETLLFSLPE